LISEALLFDDRLIAACGFVPRHCKDGP